jgi:hypothetical protein
MIQKIIRTMNEHDAALEKAASLPAAGETAYTDPIDLGTACGLIELADVELHVDATAAAAGKRIILTPEHSADGVTFEAAPLPGMTVTGGATGGTLEYTAIQFGPEPVGVRRYLRLAVEVEAEAGDVTESKAWIAVVPQPRRYV